MKYYIIDNRILKFDEDLNPELYSYQKLSEQQTAFYEANKNASIKEVLAMALDPIVIPIVDINTVKSNKISEFKRIANNLLSQTDYKVIRQRDQIAQGIQTTLANDEYMTLLAERESIRDKSNSLEIKLNTAATIEEINLIVW